MGDQSRSGGDPVKTYPAWRKGWTWTLMKCATALVTTALAGVGALWVVLRWLLTRMPGWLPASWLERLFRWALTHVWFVGVFAGLFVGLVLSLGIVILDARAGRLTRVR